MTVSSSDADPMDQLIIQKIREPSSKHQPIVEQVTHDDDDYGMSWSDQVNQAEDSEDKKKENVIFTDSSSIFDKLNETLVPDGVPFEYSKVMKMRDNDHSVEGSRSSTPKSTKSRSIDINLRSLTQDELSNLADRCADIKREQANPQLFDQHVESLLAIDVDKQDAVKRVRKMLKHRLHRANKQLKSKDSQASISTKTSSAIQPKAEIVASETENQEVKADKQFVRPVDVPRPQSKIAKSAPNLSNSGKLPMGRSTQESSKVRTTDKRILEYHNVGNNEHTSENTIMSNPHVSRFNESVHRRDVLFVQSKIVEIGSLMRLLGVKRSDVSFDYFGDA